MKNYQDFIKELNSGIIRQSYYISASGNYLVTKASEYLSKKISHSINQRSLIVKYADENSLDELREFIFELPSLFELQRLILIRRCEKYSRKLDSFFELSESVTGDNYLMCIFEDEFVRGKKLDKRYVFYNFSEISGQEGISLIVNEFESRGINLDNSEAQFFLESFNGEPDFIISEINKISDYLGENRTLNRETLCNILKFNTEFSFDELFISLIKKDSNTTMKAINNILDHQGISDIYLLVVLSMFYTDLLFFKKSTRTPSGFWGDRARLLRECSNEISERRIKLSVNAIIEVDKMMKNTMTDSKVLIFNLIGTLLSIKN